MDLVNSIKSQYARILAVRDWRQFKQIAEYYLKVAARLKKKDIAAKNNKLLLRNAQKRLYLGIGCELIIKAYYLKEGYCINKFNNTFSGEKTPTHKLSSLNRNDINHNNTFTLDALINNLNKISSFESHDKIKRGFQIAMVFRNKEGHVTYPTHEFDEQNYRDVENALKIFYKEAFDEKLSFRISMGLREKSIFRISA